MAKQQTKYCPFCKEHKSIESFDKEGKNRFDRDGEPSRRRMCTQCRWLRRKEKQELVKSETKEYEKSIINAIIQLGRHNIDRVSNVTKKHFIKKTNAHDLINDIDFDDMKKKAIEELLVMGYHRKENISLPAGNYLVVGDSHGIHTTDKMFDLLHQLNYELDIDNIIHIGHLLDDDNEINENWFNFNNLILISRLEEIKLIEQNLCEINLGDSFEIIRNEIEIGDYKICNQDMIRDYVKTFIGNLDPEIFPEKTITCSHRHEIDVRCSYAGRSIIMSPGCLCENHIIKTIKQIDFQEGSTVKLAYHDGFVKYRRMGHMFKYWQNGAVVVHYDGENTTCIPIRIKQIGDSFVTSYFDKIITNDGVFSPDKKIFINGDIHVTYQDDDVLDIQEQVCKDYKPDVFVTLGDTYNCSALNHHKMDRGGVITGIDLLDEMSTLNYVLTRMGKWAKEKYIFFGNHERFLRDFVDKYPQLEKILDYTFLSGLDDLGYNFIDLKDVLEIGTLRLIHGDMKMYGGKGKRMERASRVFKECIMGHVHYPSCRFGCYSVGLSGVMDHDYNEPNASNWTHSFILCNQYEGENFISPIIITDYNVLLGDDFYTSNGSDFSKFTTRKVKLMYSFDE